MWVSGAISKFCEIGFKVCCNFVYSCFQGRIWLPRMGFLWNGNVGLNCARLCLFLRMCPNPLWEDVDSASAATATAAHMLTTLGTLRQEPSP